MKIEELKGKDIIKAYDGDYLSYDFGYSCANFNVRNFQMGENSNDIKMFELYIENPNNISCFVAYNKRGKIKGRRMFFKGPSLLNDEEYPQLPVKMGEEVKYLYGYYGADDEKIFEEIIRFVFKTYKGIIHTDRRVFKNGVRVEKPNFFMFSIENAKFPKYPPVDNLYISPELSAFSNFDPHEDIVEMLERDFKVRNITFHHAYRFNYYRKKGSDFLGFSTWSGNSNNIDIETEIQDDDDDDEGWEEEDNDDFLYED